ncbi:MAG: 50S ribosomal protein L9 [Oscillospiraceae bacterium]|nr:50S ribosomal protein L9 [Oscillospiraceae bacterium]
MKVILQADVKDQGKRGDLVDVSDGYARNFLLPRKLAVEATAGALNDYKSREAAKRQRAQAERENAARLSKLLKETVITVTARGGSAGRLFGSVTSREVADALKSQHNIEIDKHRIVMTEPLRTAGRHTVQVKLGYETVSSMTVDVVVDSGPAGKSSDG